MIFSLKWDTQLTWISFWAQSSHSRVCSTRFRLSSFLCLKPRQFTAIPPRKPLTQGSRDGICWRGSRGKTSRRLPLSDGTPCGRNHESPAPMTTAIQLAQSAPWPRKPEAQLPGPRLQSLRGQHLRTCRGGLGGEDCGSPSPGSNLPGRQPELQELTAPLHLVTCGWSPWC